MLWPGSVDTAGRNERSDLGVAQSGALFSDEARTRHVSEPAYRLIVSIANQVRSSVASIVYSADVLHARAGAMPPELVLATVHDISAASRHLQLTVDGLLDYARLGPAISVPISLRELLNRVQGLLKSLYRGEAHRLDCVLSSGAEWVRGNPVMLEQELLDACLRAAEQADGPRTLLVSCAVDPQVSDGDSHVLVSVSDGGRTPHHLRLTRSEGPR